MRVLIRLTAPQRPLGPRRAARKHPIAVGQIWLFRSIKRLNIRNFTGLALGYGAGNNKDLSAITNAPIGQNV